MTHPHAQVTIGTAKRSNRVEISLVDASQHALARDLIKLNDRGSHDGVAAIGDKSAKLLALKRAIPVQSHGDVVVRLVVAHEVDDRHELLLFVNAQAASELLHKDDRRLRGAGKDDLVDRGDIDALVKDVDRKQELERIRCVLVLFEARNSPLTLLVRRRARKA